MNEYPYIKKMLIDGLDEFFFVIDGSDWIFLKKL